MRSKIVLFFILFSNTIFAKDFSFSDRVTKIVKTKETYSISFFIQSARYKLVNNKDCIKKLQESMDEKKEVKIIFNPQNLNITKCL